MCGEQTIEKSAIKTPSGSSPRVRGAARCLYFGYFEHGIIPACAGSRPDLINPATMARGSSPRVRGAVLDSAQNSFVDGIIPACAGSSDHLLRLYSNGRDHPRVCGEQRRLTDRVSHLRGSSPRVRGAVPVRLRGVAGPGIIPACAGSSWCKTAICKTSSGTSPRVRGAVKKVNSNIRFDGIIPACAGSRTCATTR